MNSGTYGSIRLADVDINDIDVFYTYIPNRDFSGNKTVAKKLDAKKVLTQVITETDETLGGLYTLQLPTQEFSELGIYNILITPKALKTTIVDNGVLTSRSDIRGLVIDINDESLSNDKAKLINGGLDGFRIEYINKSTGLKIPNLFRIVTSSNKCEPVSENVTNSSQKLVKYRFSEFSNLLFMTLTPSATSDIKANIAPFLGDTGQKILIYNTYFDPIMLEVNIVDTTLETLKHGIFGNQVETKDGRLTIFTADDEKLPYKAYNLLTEKDEYDVEQSKIKMGIDNPDTDSFDEFFDKINL